MPSTLPVPAAAWAVMLPLLAVNTPDMLLAVLLRVSVLLAVNVTLPLPPMMPAKVPDAAP